MDLLEEDDIDSDGHYGDEYDLTNEDNLLDDVEDMLEDLEEDSLVGDQRDYEYQSPDLHDSSIDLEGNDNYDDDLVEEDTLLDDSFGDNSHENDSNLDTANLAREDLQRLVNVFQKQISYMKNRLVMLQQELQKKNHVIENLTWRYESGDLPSSDASRPDTNSVEDMRKLMTKSEMIAQKTMLENFELREERDELKETLRELKGELKQRKSTDLEALQLDEKKPHRRKRSMSVGAIAWLEDDDDDVLETMDDTGVKKKAKGRRARDPSLGAVADLFDPAERLEMGFDKDGHATKGEEVGQWFWMPTKPNPAAPVQRRVDPSFGGVAELFGDMNAMAHPSGEKSETHSKASTSFGGVMDMFGATQDEAEEEDNAVGGRIQTKSRKRDPSFGGVADMFGDDEGSDEEPEMDGASRTQNVGDFFNDTFVGKPPSRVSKKRDPSFSGVADLFEDDFDEDEDDLSPLNSEEDDGPYVVQPKTDGGKRKRDPSFSGVASLFGDDSEGEDSSGKAAGGTHKAAQASVGFGVSGMSFSQKFGAGEQEEPQTSGRGRKRDPSFGGVADMFADDADSEGDDDGASGTSGAHRKAEPSIGFGISDMSFSAKFGASDVDVKKSEPTTKPPPPPPFVQKSVDNSQEIKTLKKRLKDVEDSKRRLAQVLSLEFDRLREIIKALSIQAPQAVEGSILASIFGTVA